jgi:hypothetical protein
MRYFKIILYIICGALFFSCASRKVYIDKKEIIKDSLVELSIKKDSIEISNENIINNIVIDDYIITPIDSSKEIYINGKIYKNVILRHLKVKYNSLYNKDKIVSKNEDKQQKTKVLVKDKEIKKEIDKKANYYVYLWLLLIPFIYYFIKYKSYFKWFL